MMSSLLLFPALKLKEASFPSITPVEEREAAYLAARERIFSLHHDDKKEPVAPKPRSDPVVARRMIAHALGQRICPTSLNLQSSHQNCKEDGSTDKPRIGKEIVGHSTSPSKSTKNCQKMMGSHERKANINKGSGSSTLPASHSEIKAESKTARSSPGNSSSLQNGSHGKDVGIQNMEREHLGAAKRMFAHALGLASVKSNQSG